MKKLLLIVVVAIAAYFGLLQAAQHRIFINGVTGKQLKQLQTCLLVII